MTREEPTIPGYEIVSPLGAGGWGTVYLATQSNLARRVALKVLLDSERLSPTDRRRFQREARIMAGIHHPSIVSVYGSGTTPVPFIAMEYLTGGTLRDRLDAAKKSGAGGLPLADLGDLIRQLLEALEVVHAAGIIHRDVKPRNILFREAGQLVLGDLGVAKVQSADMTALTVNNQVFGTMAYLPPEAIFGGALDVRRDLFAAGVVGYEMVCGTHPTGFKPFTPGFAIEPPARRRPDCPPPLARLLEALMDEDPARRPGTAGEALDMLAGGPRRPTAASGRIPVPAGGRPGRKRRIAAVIAVVITVVAVAVTVSLLVMSSSFRSPARLEIHGLEVGPDGATVWVTAARPVTVGCRGRAGVSHVAGSPTAVAVDLAPSLRRPGAQEAVLDVGEGSGGSTPVRFEVDGAAIPVPKPIEEVGVGAPLLGDGSRVKTPKGWLSLPEWLVQSGIRWYACLLDPISPSLNVAEDIAERFKTSGNLFDAQKETGTFAGTVFLDPKVYPLIFGNPSLTAIVEFPFGGETPDLAQVEELVAAAHARGARPLLLLDLFPWDLAKGWRGRYLGGRPPATLDRDVKRARAWREKLARKSPAVELLPPAIDMIPAWLRASEKGPLGADLPALRIQVEAFGRINSVVAPVTLDDRVWEASIALLERIGARHRTRVDVRWVWILPGIREAPWDDYDRPLADPASRRRDAFTAAQTLLFARRHFPAARVMLDLSHDLSDPFQNQRRRGDLRRSFDPSRDWPMFARVAEGLAGLAPEGPAAPPPPIGLAESGEVELVGFSDGARRVFVLAGRPDRASTARVTCTRAGVLTTLSAAAPPVRRLIRPRETLELTIDRELVLFRELVPVRL